MVSRICLFVGWIAVVAGYLQREDQAHQVEADGETEPEGLLSEGDHEVLRSMSLEENTSEAGDVFKKLGNLRDQVKEWKNKVNQAKEDLRKCQQLQRAIENGKKCREIKFAKILDNLQAKHPKQARNALGSKVPTIRRCRGDVIKEKGDALSVDDCRIRCERENKCFTFHFYASGKCSLETECTRLDAFNGSQYGTCFTPSQLLVAMAEMPGLPTEE